MAQPLSGEDHQMAQVQTQPQTENGRYFNIVMTTTAMVDNNTGNYVTSKHRYGEENAAPGAGYAESGMPFVKSLIFKLDLQNQVQLVSRMVKLELDAGQRSLNSARWLAVSKNWSTVAVNQYCLDETSKIRDILVDDPSVRLVQTAARINPTAAYLSQNAMYVQFEPGVSHAKEFLTTEDDCAVLIPLSVPKGAELCTWERSNPYYRIGLSLAPTFGYILSGCSVLKLDGSEPLVCVIYGMAAINLTSYTSYSVGEHRPGFRPYGP